MNKPITIGMVVASVGILIVIGIVLFILASFAGSYCFDHC